MAKVRSGSRKGFRRYKIELTAPSLFLWCACFIFILAWMFVLGILVGRGFLPGAVTAVTGLKNQISRLHGTTTKKERYDSIASKKAEADPKLAFYEQLSSKRDAAKNRQLSEESAKRLKRQSAQQGLKIPRDGPRALEPKGDETPKSGSKPPAQTLQYTVQLASLEVKSMAEEMIKRLNERGCPAYFREARVKGKTYYRVRCGRFASREEAGDYAKKVETAQGIKGFVSRIE